GRMLVYRGSKDGVTQTDRVRVTRDTKVIEGITATAVSDVATHRGKILEKTLDYYAQDKDGNVWYLGENTKELLPNGKVDRSGSWMSGVHDGEPGLIMEAHPRVPDGDREAREGQGLATSRSRREPGRSPRPVPRGSGDRSPRRSWWTRCGSPSSSPRGCTRPRRL